ncbi:hypothetical protein CSO01_15330 [Cellulomonas soli]|uniref:Ricin B lectin domain-containing protein n=1 Tax=Cellulomonas soli TaxID=931535 RepID=A0A512PC97_9CELL|nr:hypothetical protein CSO01_15330 [Cellulomonas soli]
MASATPTTAAAATAAAAAIPSVTVTPNPWAASEPFEGWGTSLVWFANATGDYPAELRQELYDLLFSEEGLDLNIARYNIGGGNASDVVDYLRPGGAVEGWWKADTTGELYGATTSYADRAAVLAAWDADDPADYDLTADATQRWWVQQLAADGQITHWETFANSAPYFMTESGYVSGGTNSSAEQLKPEAVDDFAAYLTHVTEALEDEYGIDVDTIDPLNEPNTSYWGTTLTNGVPTGGRQEGMHVGPARQADLIDALAAQLGDPATTTDAVVSAMDETNPGTFVTNWNGYDQATRDAIDQLNVHTYGTGSRVTVRDIAKTADKALWMSEVEGSWVSGWNPSSITNGLGLAGRITDDLRELESQAWVFWQPVEDRYNMEATGENTNWGSVFVDLDCQYYDEAGTQVFKSARRVAAAGGDSTQVPECSIVTNTKYDTTRNFTHFIRPGDRIVPTTSTNATAAVSADGTATTVVYTNTGSTDLSVTVDLSRYGQIAAGATATPYVTTQSPADAPGQNALVAGTPVAVDAAARTVTLTLPARSVSSIVVDGVSGVADSAALLPDGGTVQLVGVQSSKALTATSGTAATTLTTPGTTAAAASAQVWTVHEVPGTGATRESTRRVVLTDQQGRVLGATSAGTDLRSVGVEAAAADPATRWVLSTTDGSTFALVNQGLGTALDVGGQSTAENATVGVYTSNGGTNQLWRARSTQATGSRPVTLATVVGVVPTLPSTVVPTYVWGTGVPAPVTWQLPGEDQWATTGQVVVHGTATDVYGGTVEAVATVDVGGYTLTDPVSVTTFAGASLASVQAVAPTTVPARVGASSATFAAPVTWDFSALTDADLTGVGTVAVPGTATSNDPSAAPLPATLTVILTARSTSNIATLPTTTASATFTESSAYSVDRTRNGDRTDKGWSNWKGSNKNASDTLTYTFGGARQLSEATIWFYKDGSSTSWAQSLQAQVQDATGTWVAVPGYETAVPVTSPANGSAPVVTVPLGGVDATAVRFVLNAYANTHLIVSEVEVQASGPAASSVASLGALRLDGTSVPGFDPTVSDYTVDVDGTAFPTLAAVPTDDDATVRLTQPTAANGGIGTVRVTAADGTTTTTTTVTVVRHATVDTVEVLGTAKVGQTVTTQVTTDPADAAVALTWLVDGQAIDGATGSTLVVPASAGGKALTVRAVASAEGLVDGTGESAPVTVQPLSSDARLATLTLNGTTVTGFDPATTGYTVRSAGSAWPTLAATTADPTATVRLVQPADGRGTGTVTVTAEDGSTLVYRVLVQRQVAVTAVTLHGSGQVGTRVTAVVGSDPGRAQLSYSWAVDGRAVRGANQATYVPRPADAGRALTVTVTAAARGYVTSEARTSSAVVVTAHRGGCPWVWR